jgi:hypothetical protein
MSMKYVNSMFLIRVITFDEKGRHISRLVGYKTAVKVIGSEELFHKMINRALDHGKDKERCKLRRGLMIDLYSR